jgi:hypothetical protein
MARDLHSVSSDEEVKHGSVYNALAKVGEKIEKLVDKVIGDEVIAEHPDLPFSNTTPGDVQHASTNAANKDAAK